MERGAEVGYVVLITLSNGMSSPRPHGLCDDSPMSMTQPMTTLTRGQYAPLLKSVFPGAAFHLATSEAHGVSSERFAARRADYFANSTEGSDDMGIFDKLFGGNEAPQPGQRNGPGSAAQSADEQAIARYRYMLKTAPPETIEQAHAEAFAKLTPEQRNMLLQQLSADMPDAERPRCRSRGEG